MNAIKLPSQEYLNKLFRYDIESGLLYRRVTITSRVKIGSLVGWRTGKGYLGVNIDGRPYLVHRIIYKMIRGIDPNYIDHINGKEDDNRIENLRAVTHAENCKNMKRFNTNTSGVTGVYWDKNAKKWHAQIKVNYKNIYLGLFSNIEDAADARKAAELKYGFHKNHGRGK